MNCQPPPAMGRESAGSIPDGLIFDLDGTLWDSTATVAAAWNRVFKRLGQPERRFSAKDISRIMGKPHREIHLTLLPDLSEAEWERVALVCYKEEERMIHERGGRLYPGVAAGLQALRSHYGLYIVSNCQAGYIESFLAWSGLGSCFRDFECHGSTGLSKADNLRLVAERNGLHHPSYLGDTDGDRQAASAADMPFFHAAWGFGTNGAGCTEFADFSALTRHFVPDADVGST